MKRRRREEEDLEEWLKVKQTEKVITANIVTDIICKTYFYI